MTGGQDGRSSRGRIWLEATGLGVLFFLLFGVLLHEWIFGLVGGVLLAMGRGAIQALSQRRRGQD